MNLDVIVFAAHPDDAEIGMGGTIARLTYNNFKVGIIDLTRGELGTRGTPEIRDKEASEAGAILKLALRENFHIPDGNIKDNNEHLVKIITAIRKYRPKIIFAPYYYDRHPDHIESSKIIKKAFFQSGLVKLQTKDNNTSQEAYRPSHLYYYMQTYTFEPTFIINISDYFEIKMKAVKAFKSQFHNPHSQDKETFISRPEFVWYLESRAGYFGFQIGCKYGEAFYCDEKTEMDIISLLKK